MMEYPDEHGGRFPRSDKGWGDAILLFGTYSPDMDWVKYMVGVDDDGSYLIRAMETGEDVNESQCSRIYVQGLTQKSSHNIAILFDRDSVKGGDHMHGMPGQKMLREVLMIDGSLKTIPDSDWPAFVAVQRELLRQGGFSEGEISQYYGAGGK